MKKLMFAALTAAVAGGAFAEPLVYDYKASVKHLYLKEVKVNIKDGFNGIVYQKYQKTASLKGYLIMDADGVTSPTINTAATDAMLQDGIATFDYGRNRGFLVVKNLNVESGLSHPKILPAVLDAKWIDTAFTKDHKAASGLAEGTLYVGGDAIAPVRPQLDMIGKVVKNRRVVGGDAFAVPSLPLADTVDTDGGTPGMVAIADYVWTSIYLFGQYNGPNWFERYDEDLGISDSPFGQFEYAWDQELPHFLKTGWAQVTQIVDNDPVAVEGSYAKAVNNYFHDTWMNGSGVGKYVQPKNVTGKLCCGLKKKTTYNLILDTLSGNLKGGIFLCTENGIDAEGDDYQWFDGVAWEDQFNTARITDKSGKFNFDSWQNDLWQDGFFEQETTDVVYGTWTIKWNSTFMDADKGKGKEFLPDDFGKYAEKNTTPDAGWAFSYGVAQDKWTINDKALWVAIYGAAYDLDKGKVNFWNGREIYNYTSDERFDIPMITPQFARHYRLIYRMKIN